MEKKRYFGLDAVRIMALCLLLWLHFFLRSGFYSIPVGSLPMTLAAAGRIVFMCCIPLFLMLTGYLKCARTWRPGYYRSLLPILISWVIISLICLGYDLWVKQESKPAYLWLTDFFNFDLANYSWYIEMYIGLLLVSPFLNLAWVHLDTKKNRTRMVLVFVLLTILPPTVNFVKADGKTVLNLAPNYWTSLYFFTYYLIGCYIRTYRPVVKRRFALPAAVGIALLFAMINRLTAGEAGKFSDGYTISYNHLGTAAIAVLLFLSVYRTRCRSRAVCRAAQLISGVTLEMYLISCVFDQKIYAYQRLKYGAEQFWWRGILACGLVFVLSFLSGWTVHQISARMAALIWRIGEKTGWLRPAERNAGAEGSDHVA